MKLQKFLPLALLMAAPLLHAATWVTIAPESTTTAVSLPAGATYRLGDATSNKWSASTTVAAAKTFTTLSWPAGVFPFSDPAPNTLKSLQVLEVAAAQIVTVVDSSVAPSKIASMTVPGIALPATLGTTPGSAYVLTFSNLSVIPGSVDAMIFNPASGMVPASQLIGTLLSGIEVNITIGGVQMACGSGQSFTNGNFNLSCVVAATVASK